MSSLQLAGVSKHYGDTQALDDVSFECAQGEFFSLFGPSGAGKTTILELVAGVKSGYRGSIRIGGQAMDGAPVQSRNVAMAFENYMLYPHLSVSENIAFPLRSPMRKRQNSNTEIRRKVRRIADELGIGELLERTPARLSGGQRQRVSLARALVREADVYLLDEPIAHLDAQLRTAARANLKAMAANIGSTIVYVTHDYREALGMSDRVLVLHQGRVLQIGRPREIYNSPKSDFVGMLVGDPAMNLVDGMLHAGAAGPVFKTYGIEFALSGRLAVLARRRLAVRRPSVRLGIRPSAVRVSAEKQGVHCAPATVYAMERRAEHDLAHFEIGGTYFSATAASADEIRYAQQVWLTVDGERGHLFDATFPIGTPAAAQRGDAA